MGVMGVMCDVMCGVAWCGVQRNERRKWIHCFERCSALLFVTAISEYDEVLYEDHSVNRMVESINLFAELCNSKWYHTVPHRPMCGVCGCVCVCVCVMESDAMR